MKPHSLAAEAVNLDTAIPADDFKLIHGIGASLEARLQAAGIRTYDQLAAMTPETIISALGNVIGLTPKRIVDQNWLGQAQELKGKKHLAAPEPDTRAGRQHYATFTVELLLGEDNAVRRTRAVYIQSEKEDAWAGWNENRLVEFIAQQSALQPSTPVAKKDPPIEKEPANLPGQIQGNLQLKSARISGQATHRGHILGRDEPFEITLPFDLADVTLSGYNEIDFRLNLNAKELRGGSLLQLGETKGKFLAAQENEVTLQCSGLNQGVYRIHVDLSLNPSLVDAEADTMRIANLDCGLLQIY